VFLNPDCQNKLLFCSVGICIFDTDSQKKVTESYVVVIGLGGVGSHAASMLLRSGVSRLLLVDFAQVWIYVFQRSILRIRIVMKTWMHLVFLFVLYVIRIIFS
jgi:threonine dehydrogenase-like Zn-dependent dehydrogenase